MFSLKISTPVREALPFGAASLLLITGTVVMLPAGMLHTLGVVPIFLGGATLMLAGFFVSLRMQRAPLILFWLIPIFARILLLWQAPGDDIYRYVWEGRILGLGWNPYIYAPASETLAPFRDTVWPFVQHGTFSAIYPPIAEWIFAGISAIAPSAFAFKAVFLVADIAVAGLLAREFGSRPAGIYLWNPLIIYSFAGGGHYDSLFLLGLTTGWILWRNNRVFVSALGIGFAIGLKWLALPILGWMVWDRLRNRRFLEGSGILVLGLLPVLLGWLAIGFWTGEWTTQLFPEKFSQHARSADFVTAIVTYFDPTKLYTNSWMILPLAGIWAGIILVTRKFEIASESLLFATLVCSPLVHGWYFTWLIPFACATRNAGTIAVSASAFVYFMLYHHVELPGGMWLLSPLEIAALWLPLIIGFGWTFWIRTRRVS